MLTSASAGPRRPPSGAFICFSSLIDYDSAPRAVAPVPPFRLPAADCNQDDTSLDHPSVRRLEAHKIGHFTRAAPVGLHPRQLALTGCHRALFPPASSQVVRLQDQLNQLAGAASSRDTLKRLARSALPASGGALMSVLGALVGNLVEHFVNNALCNWRLHREFEEFYWTR